MNLCLFEATPCLLGSIHGQRDYFAAFNPRTTPRHYVAGETHYYLGKTYRLRLRGGEEAVRIQEERLVVFTHDSSPASVEKAIAAWYRKEAKLLFARLFLKCWARFQYVDAEKPKVVIKKMRKRWGSLSSGGILTLNPDLVRASESCAEYVICHELCHQEFPNHSADFYKKLESVMPDWEKRKQRLELTMK